MRKKPSPSFPVFMIPQGQRLGNCSSTSSRTGRVYGASTISLPPFFLSFHAPFGRLIEAKYLAFVLSRCLGQAWLRSCMLAQSGTKLRQRRLITPLNFRLRSSACGRRSTKESLPIISKCCQICYCPVSYRACLLYCCCVHLFDLGRYSPSLILPIVPLVRSYQHLIIAQLLHGGKSATKHPGSRTQRPDHRVATFVPSLLTAPNQGHCLAWRILFQVPFCLKECMLLIRPVSCLCYRHCHHRLPACKVITVFLLGICSNPYTTYPSDSHF